MSVAPAPVSPSPDLAGLFAAWDAPAAGPVSFAAPGAPPEGSVWRSDLPADPAAAAARLDEQLAQLQAAAEAVPAAEQRLDSAAQQARAAAEGALSFAAGEAMPEPERALLESLAELRQPAAAPVSFGAPGEPLALPPEWRSALDELRPILERVQRSILYHTYVETALGGRVVAHTALTWLGDAETEWRGRSVADEVDLHQRSLKAAVASRNLLLRVFLLSLRFAGSLATPGGVVLSLPAAWKFVNQVLAEMAHYRRVTQAG